MPYPATRAARRALSRKHPHQKYRPHHSIFDSKRWDLLCLRRNKLPRAKKLGKLWPHPARKLELMLTDDPPLRVLFICSRNQWRSPTAEHVFRKDPGVETRSAGTSQNARRRVTLADIRWADLILAMEEKHASRLRAEFRQDIAHKALHVLDIPDDYRFMDPDLVTDLRETAGRIIDKALIA